MPADQQLDEELLGLYLATQEVARQMTDYSMRSRLVEISRQVLAIAWREAAVEPAEDRVSVISD